MFRPPKSFAASFAELFAPKNFIRSLRSLHLPTLFIFLSLLLSAHHTAAALGTVGKLSGRVTEKATGDELPGVSVVLVGTRFGVATNAEGYYNLLNLPPGKYEVRFSSTGYRTFVVRDIQISADKTTTINAVLEESQITAEAVVVTAERPVIEPNLTSSVATVTAEDIRLLPVQELQDVVNLQAGVVDGHFRGGRLGEVQYLVNGVSVNNPFNNASAVKIDRSLIEEVQVISGTFDAEYGQAASGVVSTVLKSGGDQFTFGAEVYQGDFAVPGVSGRTLNYSQRLGAVQNYQLNVSGPVGLPQTYFILSGRRFENNGYLYGQRVFSPTDKNDFANLNYNPTGDGQAVPLAFSREWSGLAQITTRLVPSVELKYQFLFNAFEGKAYDGNNRANFNYRYNPDGSKTQRTTSIVQGLDWVHTLSPTTFYNLSVRQNAFSFTDFVYEDLYDPRYLEAGIAQGNNFYDPGVGAVLQGVDFGRYKQSTTNYIFKGSITSQVAREHLVKTGFEFQAYNLQFGAPGYIENRTIGNDIQTVIFESDGVEYQGVQVYNPINFSAYAQDQLEWFDITMRAGVRFEYYDSRAFIPSDPANPANVIQGAPLSTPKATTPKVSIAPRLGISYPISTTGALFFAYGHFYQMPEMGIVFANSNYEILKNLQDGGVSYGVLGNPDIKPEKTVQYELGYKQAITRDLGADLTIFYKDIRDLLGTEFVSTYAAADYARLTNVDFGSVHGFTLSLDQRRLGLFSSTIDYTWQLARGNSSDPRETATAAEAGRDPRPRQVALGWDQRHTINLTASVQRPDDFSVTAIVRFFSGTPYTPVLTPGVFNADLEVNSESKQASVLIDLRGEKSFRVGSFSANVFLRVFNVLDTRFSNGFVFTDTGSPDYSLDRIGSIGTLRDPSRLYQPRRLELGISIR
ncbi:MAG: TonB-dependent receptor [Rhizobacter sp.]|nr:TonB-dependent receptor [Chlorobiales bacterium]